MPSCVRRVSISSFPRTPASKTGTFPPICAPALKGAPFSIGTTMHEMALCTEVVDNVVAAAEEADAVTVDGVSMVIGEMRDIVVDLFDGFFHFRTRNTIAENAVVSYVTVPVTVDCRVCGQRFPVNMQSEDLVACPRCGATDYVFATGNEFFIESIDVTTRSEQLDKTI